MHTVWYLTTNAEVFLEYFQVAEVSKFEEVNF